MSILVRMADVYGATELMDISQAHIDSTIYLGDATLEFAERLASLGARVAVPTSLNVSGVDECGWKDWAVKPEWAAKAARQMLAYERMGAVPTWTCAPYQTHMRPVFGQQIAWGESNAISFANSVIGARTERYPDLLDICCAITGRVPAVGLHLAENRARPDSAAVDRRAGGAAAGRSVLRRARPPRRQARRRQHSGHRRHRGLAGRGSAEGVRGRGRFVRPRRAVPHGRRDAGGADARGRVSWRRRAEALRHWSRPTIDITTADLRAARRELTTADGRELDMVILGSPHFSLAEFSLLAPLVAGQRAHPRVKFLITSSRLMKERAHETGVLAPIVAFGAQITLDTCILASPMLPPEIKTLMTNSAKYAYYAPSLLNTRVTFGSLADCVRSAIEGRVVRDESLWQTA